MKVVHITTVPESLVSFLGGLEEYLRGRGVDVVGITSPGPHLEKFVREHPGTEVLAIEMPRRISPIADLQALVRLVLALRRIKPDIVHAHTPKGGLLGVLAARLVGVPVRIYHLRGLPLETATGWRRGVLRLAERTSCTLATCVLSVSESLRAVAIREKLVAPNKIRVPASGSGQGVDAAGRFDPARVPAGTRRATRARLGIPDDAVVIGFVGRLVQDKGINELAVAWRELTARYPHVHLIIVGATEVRDSIHPALVRSLEADSRVHLIGFDWNIAPLYAAMDVVALPTYREGFPNVPLEAAAMSLPVVATRVAGCIDAVVDETTGRLVAARDAHALATALAEYVENPSLRAAHGAAGRQRVLRAFRPELIWEATHQTYHHLRAHTPRSQGLAKRLLDVAGASIAIAALSPVIAASALAIRVTMGTPVLFAHVRPGLGGKLFTLYKFRTMRAPKPEEGAWFRTDEERLTRLGRFLRRSSIDELPGLLNVLRGEMSLVGPRPLLKEYLQRYSSDQHRRHTVRPGITGWAQVHGRQTIKFSKRIEYDLWYVDHWSLLLDLEILARTVIRVFRAEGVIPGQNVDDVDDLGLTPDRPPAPR